MNRKGYVIVDVPDGCDECQLCSYDDFYGFICCGLVDSELNEQGFTMIDDTTVANETKPDWCPIRQFPAPPDGNYDYVDGYVDCLLDMTRG